MNLYIVIDSHDAQDGKKDKAIFLLEPISIQWWLVGQQKQEFSLWKKEIQIPECTVAHRPTNKVTSEMLAGWGRRWRAEENDELQTKSSCNKFIGQELYLSWKLWRLQFLYIKIFLFSPRNTNWNGFCGWSSLRARSVLFDWNTSILAR